MSLRRRNEEKDKVDEHDKDKKNNERWKEEVQRRLARLEAQVRVINARAMLETQ